MTTDESVCFHNDEYDEITFCAIRSQYQNVEETEIYVCVLFGHLCKGNCCTGVTSEKKCLSSRKMGI